MAPQVPSCLSRSPLMRIVMWLTKVKFGACNTEWCEEGEEHFAAGCFIHIVCYLNRRRTLQNSHTSGVLVATTLQGLATTTSSGKSSEPSSIESVALFSASLRLRHRRVGAPADFGASAIPKSSTEYSCKPQVRPRQREAPPQTASGEPWP